MNEAEDVVELKGRYTPRYRVLYNPTPLELEQLLSSTPYGVRGLIDHHGDLYVWDGEQALHSDVADHLGLGKSYHSLVIDWKYISVPHNVLKRDIRDVLKSNSTLTAMKFHKYPLVSEL